MSELSELSESSDITNVKDFVTRNFIPVITFALLIERDVMFARILQRVNIRFLTLEDLLSQSLEYYENEGRHNLQKTIVFIKEKLKMNVKNIFNAWICFKFGIITKIPDETMNDPQIFEETRPNYLPPQLMELLDYLFHILYRILTTSTPGDTPERIKMSIMMNVCNVVNLFSKLYMFLQTPIPSMSMLPFNKEDISFTLLLNILVYLYFDTLHSLLENSSIFNNYIYFLNDAFGLHVRMFKKDNDTPEILKSRIDNAFGHIALYLLHLPNLSEILSGDSHETVDKILIHGFAQMVQEKSLDVSAFNKEDDFNPMTALTLSNAIELVSEVIKLLNKKFHLNLSETDGLVIIEKFQKRFNELEKYRDYFNFLYVIKSQIEQFTLSKDIFCRADYSQCCVRVPVFEFYIPKKQNKATAKPEKEKEPPPSKPLLSIKARQTELERQERDRRETERQERDRRETERQERERQERERRETERRELERQQEQKKRDDAAAKKIFVYKVQRNAIFRKMNKDDFSRFAQHINGGDYENAVKLLNEQYPTNPLPWTMDDMKSISSTDNYKMLLASISQGVTPISQGVTPISPVITPPPLSEKAQERARAKAAEEQQRLEKQQRLEEQQRQQRLEEQRLKEEARALIIREKKDLRKDRIAAEKQAAAEKQEQQERQAAAEKQERQATEQQERQAAAEQQERQAAAEQQAFHVFSENIRELYGGGGIRYFEMMFCCSLPQFFRITNVVRELPDEEIIRIMSSLVPVRTSDSARAPPLTQYMDLANSGQNCRAFFVLALLSGIRNVDNVRFSFIGRTFLQLVACHSMLSPETCETLHIPKNTSDFDVYIIFNEGIDPMMMRPFFLHIFNLFWNIPTTNIHIHYSRDHNAWTAFEETGNGHLYESVTRGSNDVMKISFNKQGSVVEVSDIGFKTVQQFSDIFCFSKPVARVNNLQLLELKYVLDKEIFFLEPQPQNPCVVQLDLQFPPAFNGADESIEIIFNILTSFLTNNLNISGSGGDRPRDFYFIHVSNLLKFIVRAIQYIHIKSKITIDYNLTRRVLAKRYEIYASKQELPITIDIQGAAIELINLFFNCKGRNNLNDDFFKTVDAYRSTGALKAQGAEIRTTRFKDFHTLILGILQKYGFVSAYLDQNPNLYGGIKQQQQRRKITKKNIGNKKKRYSRKINTKIKKIKLKNCIKKSLKKYNKSTDYKLTKKY